MYEYFDYDIENASFEWDDEKDQLNFTKHGIRFRTIRTNGIGSGKREVL